MTERNTPPELDFEDIRPYNEEELQGALKRFERNKALWETVSGLLYDRVPKLFIPFVKVLIKLRVRFLFRNAKTIDDMQKKIMIYRLLQMIESSSTDGVSSEGTDHLNPEEAYIYISNHRDIVLDPAFMIMELVRNGIPGSEVAFGDNLLVNDFVSDFIRMNKGFIVKRGLPPREQLQASIQLSQYISWSHEQGKSLWVAQREGRAKDGDDRTNPAVIKMIHIAQRKSGMSYSDFISWCKIIPVAISYEYDPLDRMKAWEVYRKRTRGEHKKGKKEDLVSMFQGIKGYKGRIQINFGTPLQGDFSSEKEAAAALDREIHRGYKLWPTNYIAFDAAFKTDRFCANYTEEQKIEFLRRFNVLPDQVKQIALEAYAKPVQNKEAAEGKV